jgi:hypothetical protein
MRKGETKGRHLLAYSIVIGFLITTLLYFYTVNFSDLVIPISLFYGIFAPLIAALSILLMISASKTTREKYMTSYWEIKKKKRLQPSYIIR